MENIENQTVITPQHILKGFVEYSLEKEKKPTSAYQLAKFMAITEAEFYNHFSSITAVESAIWVDFFEQTQNRLQADETYPSYSVREKLLAFYFTWLEILKENRSYLLFTTQNISPKAVIPTYLKNFKDKFKDYTQELLAEAKETGEIPERQLIGNTYPWIFWTQAMLVLRFWLKDESPSFEQTDAYIEKAVNFGFDFMGRTVFDSAFDFVKFSFQNR